MKKELTDYGKYFKEIYYALYGNSISSRAEAIVSDITKLLLFKLLVEKKKIKEKNRYSSKEIIDGLSKFLPKRYSKSDTIKFSDAEINVIIDKLNKINIIEAPSYILGEAFQSIIGSNIRGDKGQFFTPIELINCLVDIVKCDGNGIIVDPACGTGSFLLEAYTKLIKKNKKLGKDFKIVGIDKDADMADIAYSTTKILADMYSEVYNMNSLEILQNENPCNKLVGNVDYILTNPPFGSKIGITDEKVLSSYEFGHNWYFSDEENKWNRLDTLVKNQPPQILFIELCVKLLKNDGLMAIILPEGIFGNKSLGYIWQYLRENGEILGMIDCPRNTFQPFTDTKTDVLIYKKHSSNNKNAFTLVSVALNCGHDKRGRICNSHSERLDNDFEKIATTYTGKQNNIWKKVELKGTYFVPRYLFEINDRNDNEKRITIGEMISKGYLKKKSSKEIGSEAYGTGDIPFVRTSDIDNFEISADPTNSVSEEIYNQYSKQQNLEVNDILFIADGRYRIGKTAIINKNNIKCLIQSHIEIFSLKDKSPISPYEFLYLLNSDEVQHQIRSLIFIQSTLGTLGSRINEISIPLPPYKKEWKSKVKIFKENIELRASCLSNLKNDEHVFEL